MQKNKNLLEIGYSHLDEDINKKATGRKWYWGLESQVVIALVWMPSITLSTLYPLTVSSSSHPWVTDNTSIPYLNGDYFTTIPTN